MGSIQALLIALIDEQTFSRMQIAVVNSGHKYYLVSSYDIFSSYPLKLAFIMHSRCENTGCSRTWSSGTMADWRGIVQEVKLLCITIRSAQSPVNL